MRFAWSEAIPFRFRTALLGKGIRPTLLSNIGDPDLVPRTVPVRTHYPEGRLVWVLLTSADLRWRGWGLDGPTASLAMKARDDITSGSGPTPVSGAESSCWWTSTPPVADRISLGPTAAD